jgi:hypothetical protein
VEQKRGPNRHLFFAQGYLFRAASRLDLAVERMVEVDALSSITIANFFHDLDVAQMPGDAESVVVGDGSDGNEDSVLVLHACS